MITRRQSNLLKAHKIVQGNMADTTPNTTSNSVESNSDDNDNNTNNNNMTSPTLIGQNTKKDESSNSDGGGDVPKIIETQQKDGKFFLITSFTIKF